MKSTALLIGGGRLAQHLKHWHRHLNLSYKLSTWQRAEGFDQLKILLEKHDLIWLAIRDSEIVSFYNSYLQDQAKKVVHFSGSVYDPRLISAHPLMSFSRELYDISTYQDIHFSLTGAERLHEALPEFPNSFSILKPEEKSLYHALCVMTGNFPQMLWAQTYPQFAGLRIPEKALDHYIQQVTLNFIRDKEKALTGPLVRGDWTTIEQNKGALTQQPYLLEIYKSFSNKADEEDDA